MQESDVAELFGMNIEMERTQVSDIAQIYALWNEYADAWSAGDMERWIALWVEEGIQMPPDMPRNTGKEQIRKVMQPQMDKYDYEMSIGPDEVLVLGEQAITHGIYSFTMTPREGGKPIESFGKYLSVLEKQVDGSWRISIECFNYNAPLE